MPSKLLISMACLAFLAACSTSRERDDAYLDCPIASGKGWVPFSPASEQIALFPQSALMKIPEHSKLLWFINSDGHVLMCVVQEAIIFNINDDGYGDRRGCGSMAWEFKAINGVWDYVSEAQTILL